MPADINIGTSFANTVIASFFCYSRISHSELSISFFLGGMIMCNRLRTIIILITLAGISLFSYACNRPPNSISPIQTESVQQQHHHHRPVVEGIYQKIDYSVSTNVLPQLKLYIGDSYIYASEAAMILKRIVFEETQIEVGSYLCTRIYDRENSDVLLEVIARESTRNAILKKCTDT